MSYATLESSVNSGQPIELYQFNTEGSYVYLTSNAVEVVYAGNTYVPSSVTRDRIKQSTDAFKNDVALTFPRTNEFALGFITYAQDLITTLTIFRGHLGDNDYKTYWKGRVLGAEATNNEVRLICESIFTSLRRTGIRARYEYTCRHALYSQGCGVNKTSFDFSGNVDSISSDGSTLTISEAGLQVDGYFTGGYITVNGVSRFITEHTGSNLVLNSPFIDIAVGDSTVFYAGCDHTKATCNSKFSNVVNFGGWSYIPTKNPFGSSIY